MAEDKLLEYEVFRAKLRQAKECSPGSRTEEQKRIIGIANSGPTLNSLKSRGTLKKSVGSR